MSEHAANEHEPTESPTRQPPVRPSPGDWEVRTLGEIAEWLSGSALPKSERALADRATGDVHWYGPKDVLARDASDLERVSASDVAGKLAPKGSVLVVTRGAVLARELPVCLSTHEAAFHTDIKAAVSHSGVDNGFLAQWLRGHEAELLALSSDAQGTRRIEQEVLAAVPIALPSLPEQQTIARMLGSIDSVIADSEAICAKLEAIGRGLASDLRSRGFDAKGKLREPIPAGRMPKGWTAPHSDSAEIDETWLALFGESDLPIPPIGEQKQMLVILEQHRDAASAERLTLAKLYTLRQGLRDDLLSGRRRKPAKLRAAPR